MFQLSINLVAMISAVVGAIYGGVPPLNVLQLLWVNMIMDTLAALALATEEPVSTKFEFQIFAYTLANVPCAQRKCQSMYRGGWN